MRIAVMQPYLFPYVGYFQLLHCVDAFVLLDDVAFIKRGWINRNRILVKQAAHTFTIPLEGSSQNKLIQDSRWHPDARSRQKLLATIRQEYRAAPEFERALPLVQHILLSAEREVTNLVHASLEVINAYVGLPVPLLRSSAIRKDAAATGQDRIIAICQSQGAREYVNLLGGSALYSASEFLRQGITLRLLEPTLTPYRQGNHAFVPGLSVIDLLMHNTPANARNLFRQALLR